MIGFMKRSLVTVLFPAIFLFATCVGGEEVEDLFGPVAPESYLTGRFAPEKHPYFVRLSEYGIPTRGRTIWLRRETAEALREMYVQLRKDHPKLPFWVVSGTRNWYSQKGIWEGKWTGRRKVGGRRLNETLPDPTTRARKILEFSSMPGTSRHHWGSDFDINSLTNSYYKKGQGKILFEWMRKNAGRFGFCQPYTAGRKGGYLEERWHWSYMGLARPLLREWERRVKGDRARHMGRFAGSGVSVRMAPVYVETIDAECR